MSISGDLTVVGAFFDDAVSQSGSAYVFRRTGTSWSEEAKLTVSDAAEGDWFGRAVSISGGLVVVGAFLDDTGTGSAYAYDLGRCLVGGLATTRGPCNHPGPPGG